MADTTAFDAAAAREISLCWLARALVATASRLSAFAPATGVSIDVLQPQPCVLLSLLRSHLAREALQATLRAVHSVDELPQRTHEEVSVVRIVVCDGAETWQLLNEQLGSVADTAVAWVCVGTRGCRPGRTKILSSPRCIIANADLQAALHPLEELRQACGLPIALELLHKLTYSSGVTPSRSAAAPIFASPIVSQLPFQLVLMLLRWTFFHPRVLEMVARPFTRKLALIPQQRVRCEIVELYEPHRAMWQSLYPDFLLNMDATGTSSSCQQPANLLNPPECADVEDTGLSRLSQCVLWDKQKQFYRDQGIRAWSNHLIPFGVSSSSYLAMQYARVAVDFFRQNASSMSAPPSSSESRQPNCYVWEAASGSCKFLHAFLQHFYDLVALYQLEERFGIVPCVVASDLSEQVLRSREEMPCFQQYISERRLDFALFDTDAFLDGSADAHRSRRHHLELRHGQRQWHVARDGTPVFIIGNYFFDSLRTDVFIVSKSKGNEIEIREALIDHMTDNIPDMTFSLSRPRPHPRRAPLYSQPALNSALVRTLDFLEDQWREKQNPPSLATNDHGLTHSSLVLFPTEAIAFLNATLLAEETEKRAPVAIVTGDATFSFRDNVPRSFVDEDTGDLEIPQLSPHPDCFCLPVDLEVLGFFIDGASGASSSVVSTPASDTFNVFLALSPSSDFVDRPSVATIQRFRGIFNDFTPCDCDLLWGMMSVDAGAKHLSFHSQKLLLAQTAWDFDVFSVVQWALLRHWKAGRETQYDKEEAERERRSLVEAGEKCRRTFYILDEGARSDSAALSMLQLARWFFGLEAYEVTARVLDTTCLTTVSHPRLQSASLYLRGLMSYKQRDYWAALASFRQGLQHEPNRLRQKKWVARTLLRLQEEKTVNVRS